MKDYQFIVDKIMKFLTYCGENHPLLIPHVKKIQSNFHKRYGKSIPVYNAALHAARVRYPQLYNSMLCKMELIAGRSLGEKISIN
jgi:hypothetical protein